LAVSGGCLEWLEADVPGQELCDAVHRMVGDAISKRPGSPAFRRECLVTEALDLKVMHKAELKVSEWRHDRDHHGTRASAPLVGRREAADCRGDGGRRGAHVTEVAARHGVYPGLLFTWRRQVRDGLLAPPPAATFMPVRMLATEPAPDPEVRYPANGERGAPVAGPHLRDATIEITLANGCRLRVDQQIDVRALRRIVGVLRG
jgi:transposase